jgi:hypothetical protein
MTELPSSPFVNAALPILAEHAAKLRSLAAEFSATDGSANLIFEIRDTVPTDDAVILQYRANMEVINNKVLEMQAAIEAHIKSTTPEPADRRPVETISAEYKAEKSKFSNVVSSLSVFIGDEDAEKFKAYVSEAPDLYFSPIKGVRAASTSTSTGPATPKPRILEAYVDGEHVTSKSPMKDADGKNRVSSNFTSIAAYLTKKSGDKVEVTALHTAAFEAAGTSELKGKGPVEFNFMVKDTNYLIKVVPN